MAWLRNRVRAARLLAVCACCALVGGAAPTLAAPPPRPAPEPTTEAGRTLKSLLDTAALGSAATYAHLGLRAGAGVLLFYTHNDYQPIWTQEAGWNQGATEALELLAKAPEYGLCREDYQWKQLRGLPDSLRQLAGNRQRGPLLADFELRLTDALLRYGIHLRGGRRLAGTLAPEPAGSSSAEAASRLRTALAAGSLAGFVAESEPTGRAYQQLRRAWAAALAAACPEDSARLLTGGQALFRQVAINLERLRWEAAPDSEYAVVNIPAFQLQLVRGGQVVQTHRVVVGKPEMPTPTLDSRIIVFVTSPEWRVPYSIAVNELLPEIQRDPGFLADNDYELRNAANQRVNPWRVRWQRVTPETFHYTIRQTAGRSNALGRVVFYFPNRHTVFLHDTPARTVFSRPDRALSHGCVRLEKPLALAAYLLRREGTEATLRPALSGPTRHEKRRFDLRRGLPVHFRYYTCAGENGQLRRYADIYGKDQALLDAFFPPQP
ncbi:Murein L,D-transpeptidase YcbB/YkuD [Hymenobacter daecheongensis DSM 21074]|uniref:Murein L,D-transpeptidase YcbB/YkuD n=1 Tax=Hymenobacter daecheongensis DSM 21074 TaxID=1121955 RepID=A0A1M6HLM5_9BACT|nr:L,D-transpeptidase family protein [Hymenobacter daecheongensis]SHJ23074.1 Murein L,D-transpeptidase YcbB/YkuD [Hymenobacter daecheongensis DSM 21074]